MFFYRQRIAFYICFVVICLCNSVYLISRSSLNNFLTVAIHVRFFLFLLQKAPLVFGFKNKTDMFRIDERLVSLRTHFLCGWCIFFFSLFLIITALHAKKDIRSFCDHETHPTLISNTAYIVLWQFTHAQMDSRRYK